LQFGGHFGFLGDSSTRSIQSLRWPRKRWIASGVTPYARTVSPASRATLAGRKSTELVAAKKGMTLGGSLMTGGRTSVLVCNGGRRDTALAIAKAIARRVAWLSAAPRAMAIVERVRTPALVITGRSGKGSRPDARAIDRRGRSTPAAAALPGSKVR